MAMHIKPYREYYFSVTPKHIYLAGVFLFVSLIVAYGLIKFIPFVFAPDILLIEPSVVETIYDSKDVVVRGRAKNTASLTLNGKKIYIGKNNDFRETVELQDGVNTISLEARSIFGRTAEVVRSVIYIDN